MEKRVYTTPSIEVAELAIEQGIATSEQKFNNINDIYLLEEDVVW